MKKEEPKQKKKKLSPDNTEQRIRFVKKAEEIQAEDGNERFEKACSTLLKKGATQ